MNKECKKCGHGCHCNAEHEECNCESCECNKESKRTYTFQKDWAQDISFENEVKFA